MSTTSTQMEGVLEAADAIVEFAMIAFGPEYLRWDKTVNLGVAEGVWNGHAIDGHALNGHAIDGHALDGADGDTTAVWMGGAEPQLAELVERLRTARRELWGDADFCVYGLDVCSEGGDILFRFDLAWPAEGRIQACEVSVDLPPAGPTHAT